MIINQGLINQGLKCSVLRIKLHFTMPRLIYVKQQYNQNLNTKPYLYDNVANDKPGSGGLNGSPKEKYKEPNPKTIPKQFQSHRKVTKFIHTC